MTVDLILRGASLPDGRTGQDILVKAGRIAAIEPGPSGAQAGDEIYCLGRLVTPPFVDAHFHIDATHTVPEHGIVNSSSTLDEGIRIWGELSPKLTADDFRRRALAYCALAAGQGLLAIRSHVDITDPKLVAVEALLEVKRRVKPYLELQLVAFPQQGFFSRADMAETVARAIGLGVEVVGGIPHLEPTAALGRASIEALCRIAADTGVPVDMHCDETDDPASRQIETLVHETRRLGLFGRVTGSHLTSMHGMDASYRQRLIGRIAGAGVGVVVNPAANLVLQGRYDGYPKRRGLAPMPELLAAGVPVASAQDSVLDPWYPLGRGDLLDIAWLAAHACHMTDPAGLDACFKAVTTTPAKIMGLEGYGLEPGCKADLVVLDAATVADAIRLRANRSLVLKAGTVIAETARPTPELSLPV